MKTKKIEKRNLILTSAICLFASYFSFERLAIAENNKFETQSEQAVTKSISREPQSLCTPFILPQKFSLKTLTAESKYRVAVLNSQNNAIAFVKQSSLLGNRFEIYDSNDQLVLVGKEKASSIGVDIELYDCNSVKIGTIRQDVEKSFISADASYSVRDEKDNIVFVTEKKSEESKIISILNKDQSEMASLLVNRTQKKYEAESKQSPTGREALLFLATLKIYSAGMK